MQIPTYKTSRNKRGIPTLMLITLLLLLIIPRDIIRLVIPGSTATYITRTLKI